MISSQDVKAAVRGDASPYSTFMKPGFLRRDWFLPEAALVTRSELMRDILNELERGVPDPDTAREQGADDKTVTTLRNRRFNINTVKDELFDRVYDRTNLLNDMIFARKRKKREEEEEKNKRRRNARLSTRLNARDTCLSREIQRLGTGDGERGQRGSRRRDGFLRRRSVGLLGPAGEGGATQVRRTGARLDDEAGKQGRGARFHSRKIPRRNTAPRREASREHGRGAPRSRMTTISRSEIALSRFHSRSQPEPEFGSG